MVLRTRIRGSSAPRRIRRVRNPMMVLSEMALSPSYVSIVSKRAISQRTVTASRSGALSSVILNAKR